MHGRRSRFSKSPNILLLVLMTWQNIYTAKADDNRMLAFEFTIKQIESFAVSQPMNIFYKFCDGFHCVLQYIQVLYLLFNDDVVVVVVMVMVMVL